MPLLLPSASAARVPYSCTRIVTSATALMPSVIALTANSTSSPGWPTIRLIAWQAASIGPVPWANSVLHLAARPAHAHRRGRDHVGAAEHLHIFQLVDRDRPLGLAGDQRLDIAVVHDLLLVGQLLEAREDMPELLVVQVVAQLLQVLAEGVPAGVLAEDQRVAIQARPSRRS